MRTDGAIITNAGLELISYAIANNKNITFTKTKLGKGDVNTFDEAKKLTDVVSFYKQIPITSISRNNSGIIRIRSTFTNEDFPIEVVLKEVGIFATVEGKSETLFAYVNDGAGESFPPGTSGNIVERVRDIYVGVSTAIEVNAIIDKSTVYATIFDLEEGLNRKEDKFTKNTGFNKNKSDSTSLDDSDTLATSKAVKLAMEKATGASTAAAEKEPKFDKNSAFNKNFGVLQNEVLEGHRMAQIQGVEKFGGDVQTPGVKKVGYSYWCTANKDFYICKVENSLNYIDNAYFDAFSNASLLGKLQNLVIKSSKTIFNETLSPGQSTLAPNLDKYSDDTLFRAIAPNTTSTTDGNSSRTTMIISKGELKSGITMHIRGDAPNAQGNGIFIIWKLINGSIKNVTTAQDSGFTAPAVLSLEELKISSI